MNPDKSRILVYGYGNPGRQDDGLGILLAEEIEKWCRLQGITQVDTDSNYQLNLEDADIISGYHTVIFADASKEDINDFLFLPLQPSEKVEFSMHAVSPAFILHLSSQIFKSQPETYLVHLKGYEWEFMQGITGHAKENLGKAFDYVKCFIEDQLKKITLKYT